MQYSGSSATKARRNRDGIVFQTEAIWKWRKTLAKLNQFFFSQMVSIVSNWILSATVAILNSHQPNNFVLLKPFWSPITYWPDFFFHNLLALFTDDRQQCFSSRKENSHRFERHHPYLYMNSFSFESFLSFDFRDCRHANNNNSTQFWL